MVRIRINYLSQNSEHLLFICARNSLPFLTVRAMRSNDLYILRSVAVFQMEIPSLVLRLILLSNGFVDVDGARTIGTAGAAFVINS